MPTIHSLLLKTAGLLLALSTAAMAQDYPTKPIRMVIPFPPGGSNDVVGRLFATHLSERLGKQVIVDNRGAGAGGIVGTEIVAHAPHDGYTIGVISLAHAVNPWLYKLPYDPIKAFTPVGILGSGPNVLVVNPELPVHSVKELIALAKEKPGQLQYASAGVGSFQHLGGELFKYMAKVNLLHVPFKGGGPAMTDVVGGHTMVMFSSLVQTTPQIKAGRLRALGTGGLKRSPVLPDVPTVAEAALPGFDVSGWNGLMAPRKVSPDVVARLSGEVRKLSELPEMKERAESQGAEMAWLPAAEFGTFVAGQIDKWSKVVRAAHMQTN
jgi:tripartite-type tricarboxylate transporter receptor subunit TctC